MTTSHITIDPQTMQGKPVIRGTRITVDHLLELLAGGWTNAQITQEYPHITEQSIHDALKYASARLKNEQVYLINETHKPPAHESTH
jgi:uncharacterized protein (DUF433 family)